MWTFLGYTVRNDDNVGKLALMCLNEIQLAEKSTDDRLKGYHYGRLDAIRDCARALGIKHDVNERTRQFLREQGK